MILHDWCVFFSNHTTIIYIVLKIGSGRLGGEVARLVACPLCKQAGPRLTLPYRPFFGGNVFLLHLIQEEQVINY